MSTRTPGTGSKRASKAGATAAGGRGKATASTSASKSRKATAKSARAKPGAQAPRPRKATPGQTARPATAAPPEVPTLSQDMAVDGLLHAAAVKAGAGAALRVILDTLPLLKPLIPARVAKMAQSLEPERVQRELIRTVYARHGLKPAGWELEGMLAVAQSQGVMTPLATRAGIQAMLASWLPRALSEPLLRYTMLDPLVTATARGVAATWAAGRYADGVCKLRRAGADWLPAPVAGMLRLTPAKLREWSGEALALALPPLKLAAAWGRPAAGTKRRVGD